MPWHITPSSIPGRSLIHVDMRWIIATCSLLMAQPVSLVVSTWVVSMQLSGETPTCASLARQPPILQAHLSTSGIAPALKATLFNDVTSVISTHSLHYEEMMLYV